MPIIYGAELTGQVKPVLVDANGRLLVAGNNGDKIFAYNSPLFSAPTVAYPAGWTFGQPFIVPAVGELYVVTHIMLVNGAAVMTAGYLGVGGVVASIQYALPANGWQQIPVYSPLYVTSANSLDFSANMAAPGNVSLHVHGYKMNVS